MARAISSALLALALLAAVALPTLPCLESPPAAGTRVAAYALGRLVCHQRPDRSFATCGHQWTVCGRCSGLYLGAGAGVLLAMAGVGRGRTWRQWRRRVAAAAAPTAMLWLLEGLGVLDPGNAGRFVVAAPLGAVVALWLFAIARGELR